MFIWMQFLTTNYLKVEWVEWTAYLQYFMTPTNLAYLFPNAHRHIDVFTWSPSYLRGKDFCLNAMEKEIVSKNSNQTMW